MNNIEYCTSSYFIGMKVEVGIPLPNAETFRDWAIINEIDEDLVSLQLSRDILPDGISLRVGQVLTIRSERDFQVHNCRCFIVSIGFDQELLLRLTSEIFSREVREFYRVDAFLPIKYRRSHDQNPAFVKKQWDALRKWRQDEKRARELRRLEANREKVIQEERERKLRLLDSAFSGEPADFSRDKKQEDPLDDQYEELAASVKTIAVTISGGGLNIATAKAFEPGEFILLEIFVPSLRLVVDAVARVVFSSPKSVAGDGRSCFNTGMQFVHIEETARFAISSHISSIQLSRMRHFKGFADVEPLYVDNMPKPDKHYAYFDADYVYGQADSRTRMGRQTLYQNMALGLFFVCAVCLIGTFFSRYAAMHPKNEIQNIFEKGISQRDNLTSAVMWTASRR